LTPTIPAQWLWFWPSPTRLISGVLERKLHCSARGVSHSIRQYIDPERPLFPLLVQVVSPQPLRHSTAGRRLGCEGCLARGEVLHGQLKFSLRWNGHLPKSVKSAQPEQHYQPSSHPTSNVGRTAANHATAACATSEPLCFPVVLACVIGVLSVLQRKWSACPCGGLLRTCVHLCF
jgi:hypothetical protein